MIRPPTVMGSLGAGLAVMVYVALAPSVTAGPAEMVSVGVSATLNTGDRPRNLRWLVDVVVDVLPSGLLPAPESFRKPSVTEFEPSGLDDAAPAAVEPVK